MEILMLHASSPFLRVPSSPISVEVGVGPEKDSENLGQWDVENLRHFFFFGGVLSSKIHDTKFRGPELIAGVMVSRIPRLLQV